MSSWGCPIEREVRRRITASVAAYGYEFESKSLMLDHHFDELLQRIEPQVTTGHPLLDEFFLTEFSPMTGMWIHKHPELSKVRQLWDNYYKNHPGWVKRMTQFSRLLF